MAPNIRRQKLTPHPVAALFPPMSAEDFTALVENIREHGVKVPILVHGDRILDGLNRYRACQQLGLPCPAVQWNGTDPWLEAQARNLIRRHLAKDQIYAIRKLAAEKFPDLAAPIERVKLNARRRKAQAKGQALGVKDLTASRDAHRKSAQEIGAQLGISASTVERVERLAREAPALVSSVAAGKLSVKKALREIVKHKHGDAPTGDSGIETFRFAKTMQRLRYLLATEWTRCPFQQREALLNGVEQIVRDFRSDKLGTDCQRLVSA